MRVAPALSTQALLVVVICASCAHNDVAPDRPPSPSPPAAAAQDDRELPETPPDGGIPPSAEARCDPAPVPLEATTTESDQRAQARAAFAIGAAAFAEGRYPEALAYFAHARTLVPVTPLLFNLGVTYERLGCLAQAIETFERFVHDEPSSPLVESIREHVVSLRAGEEGSAWLDLRRSSNAPRRPAAQR